VDASLSPDRLEEDAVFLGVLTARGLKPLSRLEAPAPPAVRRLLEGMGLTVAAVTRLAQNGTRLTHWILATDPRLLARYRAEFDGTVLDEGREAIRSEAAYFGYPACCAAAYAPWGTAANGLAAEDQSLLFHRACPGCTVTPRLVPHYRQALDHACRLLREVQPAPAGRAGPEHPGR
jgi:hypothetical protein